MFLKTLVLNCGSSTLKYKLFEMEGEKLLAGGLADRIGMPGSRFSYQAWGQEEVLLETPLSSHGEAIKKMLNLITDSIHGVINDVKEIQAVGHRVVHGGESFDRTVVADNKVLQLLEECSKLAPLHNPANLEGVRLCQELIPHSIQVLVFDTAFHQTMPKHTYLYPIPYHYYKDYHIRKYGFHGISHQYVAERVSEIYGLETKSQKIISCHLGNGSSLCAVNDGKSVDTTMGLTPLAGIMMGTRCGDIDPSIISFIEEKQGLNSEKIMEILNKSSGALGISGISSDFRDLVQAAGKGNDRAQLALDMFVYRVAKGIGSLVPAIGGLNILVFTAGIGQNSPEIRRRISSYLNYLGIILDEDKNSAGGVDVEISSSGSAVKVLVISTDEERMIARESQLTVNKINYATL